MGKYAQVYTRIWYDKAFNTLSIPYRFFFLYALSSPHSNMIGYYKLPLMYIMSDLGWNHRQAEDAVKDRELAHFLAYDPAAEMILIRKYLKYNQITNDKQKTGAIRILEELPKSSLHPLFLECIKLYAPKYGADFEALGDEFWKPTDTLPIPIRYPINTLPIGDPTVTVTVTERSSCPRSLPRYSDADMKFAKRLRDRILANKPDAKIPDDLSAWAEEIRLMRERDNRASEKIEAVIDWCQKDPFWQRNILSAGKLRKQFDRLEMEMKAKHEKNSSHKSVDPSSRPIPPEWKIEDQPWFPGNEKKEVRS